MQSDNQKTDQSLSSQLALPINFDKKIFTKPVIISFILLTISCVMFMTLNAHGQWDFILLFRGKKLLALLIVGFAVGVSTLLFQTLTNNPILTPTLLGFDALYILLQSILVYFFGTIHLFNSQPILKFTFEVLLMVFASMILFRLLFFKPQQSLSRLILVGIIIGVLFRSLSSLVARLLNPEDFVVIQSASFAQFNSIHGEMMWLNLFICMVCAVLVWRWRYLCDVLLLGRRCAISLGLNYQAVALRLLMVIAVLVATATAFVGPVVFLGLLVCAITNRVSQRMYHSERLVLVSLISMLCLVIGQTIFEQVFGLKGVLSVVIELIGGVVFLLMILNHSKKIN